MIGLVILCVCLGVLAGFGIAIIVLRSVVGTLIGRFLGW